MKSRAFEERRPLFVLGGIQADSVAMIMRGMPSVAKRFDVEYAQTPTQRVLDAIKSGATVCAQNGALPASFVSVKRKSVVRFPELSFELLWPLNSVNTYNPVEPAYPHGRFPYGDSFICASVKRGTKSDEIIQFCFSQKWPESWPDLELLCAKESERLVALDATNDVKIGAYINRSFVSRRLFANVNTPSNLLLETLVVKLLECVVTDEDTETFALEAKNFLQGNTSRDLLGIIEVPVHPAVAKYFELTWWDPEATYNYFDENRLTYAEYFRKLIEHSIKVMLNQTGPRAHERVGAPSHSRVTKVLSKT